MSQNTVHTAVRNKQSLVSSNKSSTYKTEVPRSWSKLAFQELYFDMDKQGGGAIVPAAAGRARRGSGRAVMAAWQLKHSGSGDADSD